MKTGTLIDNVVKTDNQVLFAEEALHLLGKGKLLIHCNGTTHGFEALSRSSKILPYVYRVYTLLRSKGYLLKRASVDRTLYECHSVNGQNPMVHNSYHYNVYRNPKNAKQDSLSFRLLIIPAEVGDFDFGCIPKVRKLKLAFIYGQNIQFTSVSVDCGSRDY
jgi:hypothetical protein